MITHASNGDINAFYNTCSHRGAPVVTEKRGKSIRLTCPYHGWSYDHHGQLKGIRDPEDFKDFDMSCRSLVTVRCERFGNLIFVNFDQDAPSLLDWLGPYRIRVGRVSVGYLSFGLASYIRFGLQLENRHGG